MGDAQPLSVEICLAHIDAAAADAGRAILSEAEASRDARFLHAGARQQFLTGRWLVRSQLSMAAPTVAPAEWRFIENAHGCPAVAPDQNSGQLVFNLSHTDGLAALVIARDVAVGVDVEDLQRRSRTVAIADRFFAPAEVAALQALPAGAQRDRFFDYWTLKEAYIKARGMGLALPLKRFAFALPDDAAAGDITLVVDPALDDDGARWWFRRIDPTARHRVSVAVAADGREVDLTVRWVAPG